MMTTIACGHICHKGGGLNVWVEECPTCGCVNPKYIEGAKCCFSCFQYPCVCGENNNENPFEFGSLDSLIGLLTRGK